MGYQLLPPLSADDEARLRDSIRERGVEVPIVVDESGAIIDGHHRERIARELGVGCPRVVKRGLAEHDKRLLSVELNLARRHFTDAQKVLLGRQIEPDAAERARRRQEALGRAQGTPPLGTDDPKGRTRDEVARTVGLSSGRTYERAKQAIELVEREAPELVPAVESGTMDLPQIRKEIKRRVPTSPIARELLAAGEEAVANAPQAAIDDWVAMTVETEALPVTAHQLSQAVSLLSRADLLFRDIRPDLLRQLADSNAEERARLERAVSLQTTMMTRCRDALGTTQGNLRRVV